MEGARKKFLGLWLEPWLRSQLEEIAESERRPLSNLVRKALWDFVERSGEPAGPPRQENIRDAT
jgi:hypothetical protein